MEFAEFNDQHRFQHQAKSIDRKSIKNNIVDQRAVHQKFADKNCSTTTSLTTTSAEIECNNNIEKNDRQQEVALKEVMDNNAQPD